MPRIREMFKNPKNSVVCFSIVVGFLIASPWNRFFPFSSGIDAGKQDSAKSGVIRQPGVIRADAPKYAKGITEPSTKYPALQPELRLVVQPEKTRRQEVLELIHYPWEDLGFDVVFMGPRRGYRAMTLTARHRIEIYVRSKEGSMLQAYDLAHELGHAFDLKNNTEERRNKWLAMRGIEPSTPWFGCDACPDYGTPAGDFAETFAFLLLGPGNFHSLMASQPTADQIPELAAFCQIDHLSELLTIPASKNTRTAGIASGKP